MSVRPFSPTDIYSFPQPPSAAINSVDWHRSQPNSPIAESMRTITPTKVPANDAPMSNPFSDPVAETSPFTDAAAPSSTSDAKDAPIEVIRRPFAPTLEDETAGIPGDRVRVVRVFDDGWAFIENVATLSRGLIPIDCLREAGEELPAFLTSKRISSMSSASGVYLGDAM
ncbi:hypothetical protein FIBSPDRAFT_744715 [Athelia psychrophila]|uniref:SH3 domain-containing protein n=1 Tax=Athelia psychrophila TaxID=1759441 RepID=A0A166HJY3_9AGAM|nr:hypothetical protein FIBSPDRAFT_744715 [Fibularhizoctonia sp. CBS 109695]